MSCDDLLAVRPKRSRPDSTRPLRARRRRARTATTTAEDDGSLASVTGAARHRATFLDEPPFETRRGAPRAIQEGLVVRGDLTR